MKVRLASQKMTEREILYIFIYIICIKYVHVEFHSSTKKRTKTYKSTGMYKSCIGRQDKLMAGLYWAYTLIRAIFLEHELA